MSPVVENLQTQWLSQMAQMRAAISDLGLDSKHKTDSNTYGTDLNLSDDEFLSSSTSDDIWDSISDYSDDEGDSFQLNEDAFTSSVHDRKWLAVQCHAASRRHHGVDENILLDHITAVLSSDSSG
jgi:antiviral helicase SLH1